MISTRTEVAEWEEPRHSGPCRCAPLYPTSPTLQHISPPRAIGCRNWTAIAPEVPHRRAKSCRWRVVGTPSPRSRATAATATIWVGNPMHPARCKATPGPARGPRAGCRPALPYHRPPCPPPPQQSACAASSSATATSPPSTASTSTSPPGPASACSAPTAPASRRRCGCSPPRRSPTRATIEVLGYELPRESKQARAECGVVPQLDNLDTTLTVEQNLIVFSHLYRVPRRDRARRDRPRARDREADRPPRRGRRRAARAGCADGC